MRETNGLQIRPCARVLAFVMLLLSGTFLPHWGRSQEGLNPSDIWYRGFLLVQGAQEDEANRNYLEALNKLTEAKPLYDHLAQQFPDFQPEIVKDRRHLIAEKRDELKSAMRSPQASPPGPPPGVPQQGVPMPNAPGQFVGPAIAPPPLPGPGAQEREMEIDSSGGAEFALPSWNEGASQALPRIDSAPGLPRVEIRRSPS
ncbi:MAG: hypothetical protein KA250_17710, partial [Verrucomicrobiales bacterium]|nr:hypothetical protein [Verrucomicrobiales bacterium]